jgi:hypothetical protein
LLCGNHVDLTRKLRDQPHRKHAFSRCALMVQVYAGPCARALKKGTAVMARNIGPEDRVVRIVVGLGLALLVYLGVLEGIAAIVVGVLAAYLVISGLLARCVFYKMVDVDTSIQEQPYSTTDDRSGL